MSQEVMTDASFRLVRDDDQGLYLVQVGFGQHFRTFAAMKTGKLDQLRAQAQKDAAAPTPPQA